VRPIVYAQAYLTRTRYMRRLLTGIALAGLLACGGGSTEPSPLTGTALFTIDRVTCTYSGNRNVTFYIAGDSVGMQALAGGATSNSYLTKATSEYKSAGNPVVQARIANYTSTGGALWTFRTNIVVPANGSVTHSFTC
jgi:hypothetical protein